MCNWSGRAQKLILAPGMADLDMKPRQLFLTGLLSKSLMELARDQAGFQEFPGGLVVRVRHFHCRGPGSIPGWN